MTSKLPTWTSATEPYLSQAEYLSREEFLGEFPRHYLCYLTGEREENTANFQTLAGEISQSVDGSEFLHVVPLAKREGGNPFGMMITLGRANNNDVPIPVSGVSKFHGFFSLRGEDWFLTDAGSLNGTWVGGERIESRASAKVELGAEITLSNSIRCWLLSSGGLFDLLQR